MIVGLALGGALANLGWAALYADRIWAQPGALLAPGGFSVLFVPSGPLAVAPWRASRAERDRFLAAAFASLPLALATARIGCLVAGCCGGIPTDLPWGMRLAGDTVWRHPTALYDIAGLLALHAAARGLPAARVAPVVLVGFGVLRLAIEPLRAAPPLGPPLVSPSWIASVWVALGLVLDRPARASRVEPDAVARGSSYSMGAR
jgi:prolipoprotein diacylglyceryltransferase